MPCAPCWTIQNGVEVDEWVVLGGVLITYGRALSLIGVPDPAGGAGLRIIASRAAIQVLHEALPRESRLLQLIRQRLHDRRVHATDPEHLSVPVETPAARPELDRLRAVALGRGIRRLPAHQSDVVVEAP